MIIGFNIYVHKFFCFEDKDAGYPKCYLYTDIETLRFDWIKVFNDENTLSPCQLCCLIELTSPDKGPVFLFIGIECEYCEFEYKNFTDKPVFPLVRYKKVRKNKTTKSGDLRLIVDLVDRVIEPSMVVPTSCLRCDYYLSNKDEIDNVRFYCPPVEFLLRDQWKDMVHLSEIKRTLHSDTTVNKYISGSTTCRNHMYQDLLNSLSVNGEQYDSEDEADSYDENDNEYDGSDDDELEEEKEDEEGNKRGKVIFGGAFKKTKY